MADSRYILVKTSNSSPLFSSDSDSDEEKISTENEDTSTYQQFLLTSEEAAQIAECVKIHEEIEKQITELGIKGDANAELRRKIRFCEDDELKKLLEVKFNPKTTSKSIWGTHHKIDCQIDRIEKKIQVTIKQCDKKSMIEDIFNALLMNQPKVWREGNDSSYDNHSRVLVKFDLSERANLMEALKLNNRFYEVPAAAQNFQGC